MFIKEQQFVGFFYLFLSLSFSCNVRKRKGKVQFIIDYHVFFLGAGICRLFLGLFLPLNFLLSCERRESSGQSVVNFSCSFCIAVVFFQQNYHAGHFVSILYHECLSVHCSFFLPSLLGFNSFCGPVYLRKMFFM